MMVRPRGAMKPAVSSARLLSHVLSRCQPPCPPDGVFSVQCDASGATWRAYPDPVRRVVL